MAGPGYEPGTLKTTGDTTELKSTDSCITVVQVDLHLHPHFTFIFLKEKGTPVLGGA